MTDVQRLIAAHFESGAEGRAEADATDVQNGFPASDEWHLMSPTVQRAIARFWWRSGAELAGAKEENARLREALEPFATVLQGNWSHQPDGMEMTFGFGEDKRLRLTLGDFRRARAALEGKR